MKVGAAFVQTLASQILQSAASILTGVLIARGLGPAGQGRYATFAAGVALGALIASLGQFHGNVLAAADRSGVPRVLLLRAGVHGGVVLALLSSVILLGGRLLTSEQRTTTAALFVIILSLEAVADMVRGINLGQHNVTGWNVAGLTQRLVYFAAVSSLTLHLGWRLESVVACWAAATFVSVVVSGGWIWFRTPRSSFTLRGIWAGWAPRLVKGIRAFIAIGFTLLLVRADVWMLRPMLGLATVGQISVATSVAEWLWYIPSILGNLMFALVAADQGAESVRRVARSARLVTGLVVPTMVVLLLTGRWLVHLLYGPAYHDAGVLFTLLLPGMAALGIHLVIDSYFAGSGFPPITIWGAIAAAVVKFGLNLVVVPWYGAVGAACVTTLVYGALLALKAVWFVRTTGVRGRDLFLANRSDMAYLRSRLQVLGRA
jgi:O-antigen/teichoic acid export membrane protein